LAPYSISTLVNVSLDRASEDRYSEALEFAQRAAAVTPLAIAPQQLIALALIEQGHPDSAIPVTQKLKTRFPPAAVFEAMAYAKSGKREVALSLIRPYEEKYPNLVVPAMWIGSVYAFMSDESNTVKWLARSADRHEYQILSIGVNPTFSTVRNTPAFRALEKRIGLD
jgi:tetratricopeptide (TPR) repeat protein